MDHSLLLSLPYEMCEEVLVFAGTLLVARNSTERECDRGQSDTSTLGGGSTSLTEPTDIDTDTQLIQLLTAHPPARRLLRSLCPHLSWFTPSHALSACNLRLFELLVEAKYHPKNHRHSLEWAFVHGDLTTLDHLRLNVHANDPSWYIPPDLVWLTCLSDPQSKATLTLDWWIKYAPRKTHLVNLRPGAATGRLRDVSELPTAAGPPEMYLKDWFLKSGLYPHHMYQCVTRPCSLMGAAGVLQWWRAHGAERMGMACQGSEVDVASARGHVDVLRWWAATGWELRWSERAMDEAAENGFVHVLEWWVRESGLRPIRFTQRMWDAGERHGAVREWLREKSGLVCESAERQNVAAAVQGNVEAELVESLERMASIGNAQRASTSRSRSRSRGRVKWDCIVGDGDSHL